MPSCQPFAEEPQDAGRRLDAEVEGAVDELEVAHAALRAAAPSAPRNAADSALRTGTSSADRQNSQVNGQPRELST
jgi:hypothetical protein